MSKKMLDGVIEALEDKKALNIEVIDVKEKSSFADTMVVASGSSSRHVKSLANDVSQFSKKQGQVPLGIEGHDVGEWVLVDLGDIIVHVMQPKIREFYQLEKLWSVAPEEM